MHSTIVQKYFFEIYLRNISFSLWAAIFLVAPSKNREETPPEENVDFQLIVLGHFIANIARIAYEAVSDQGPV